MNKNKRIIASLLAAVMLTTCFAVMNVSAMFVSPVEFDENNIILKTGVMTDTHFNVDNTTNDPRVKKAITEIQKLAGGAENLDAITISGDITDWKPDQDILRADKVFKEVLDPKNTELVMAIGNHDVYNSKGNGTQYNFFRDSTGDFTYKKPVEENTPDEITNGNYHTVINGVHFLTVYGIDGNHPQSSINWLDKHLKIATDDAPDKPAIVITHVIPSDTVYGSTPNERWSSTTIGPVLSKYPQSVVIAGHSHNTIVPETTLWQENYTAIHAGVVSSSRSNFAYMEIDKNGNVRYSRYYLNDGNTAPSKVKETFTFKTMKSAADATYSKTNRVAGKTLPYFEDSRKSYTVSMNQVFNTGTAIATFDTAVDEDMVYAYTLKIREKSSKEVIAQTSITTNFDGYTNPSKQMPKGKETIRFSFTGFKSETDYEVCVFPVDILGTEGKPLTYDYKTTKFADIPTDDFSFKPIIDFDFCKEGAIFGTSKEDQLITYNENFGVKTYANATAIGANSGKGLKLGSLRNANTVQKVILNTNYKDNNKNPINAQDPKFFSFYIDTTNFKNTSSSSVVYTTMGVKFTEIDYNNSNLASGEVTYKIKPSGAMILIDKDGYKNFNASVNGGVFTIANNFKGYVLIPITSLAVESGANANGKLDAKEIKSVTFDFNSLGYKNSYITLDDIGFAVAKGEEGSIEYKKLSNEEPKPDFSYGDTNLDGTINTLDALLILKHVAKVDVLVGDNLKYADFDQNSIINTLDALGVLKKVVNII